MEETARLLAVPSELEDWLVGERVLVVCVHLAAVRGMLVAALDPVCANLTAGDLVTAGGEDKFVVHPLAVDHLADHDLPLRVDLLQQLGVIVLKDPAGGVEVLLVCKYLVDVLVLEVTDREVDLVQSRLRSVILDAGEALGGARALVGERLLRVVLSSVRAAFPDLARLLLAQRFSWVVRALVEVEGVGLEGVPVLVDLQGPAGFGLRAARLYRIGLGAHRGHAIGVGLLPLAGVELAVLVLLVNGLHGLDAKVIHLPSVVGQGLGVHGVGEQRLVVWSVPRCGRLASASFCISVRDVLVALGLYSGQSLLGLLVGARVDRALVDGGLREVRRLDLGTCLRVQLRSQVCHALPLLLEPLPL